MAQIISLVVYEINGVKLKQTQTLGFSVDNFIVYPYTGTNPSLNCTIEILADDASKTFSVVESQEEILALANAGIITGAINGLNISGSNVKLGGLLVNNTSIDGDETSFSIDFKFLNEFNVRNTNAIKLGLGSPSGIFIQGSQTTIGDWDGQSNGGRFGIDDYNLTLTCDNITSETIGDTITGWIKIVVDGTPRLIPFYNLA